MSILPPPARLRTTPIPIDLAAELAPRILKTVDKRPGGCWVRTCRINPSTGYSSIVKTIDFKRTYYYAHRVMYVYAKGLIPDGYTVDHMCEVPPCCNPEHLQAVTHRNNVLRSLNNPTAIKARQVRCARGHEFTTEARGRRVCLVCKEAARKARKAAGSKW